MLVRASSAVAALTSFGMLASEACSERDSTVEDAQPEQSPATITIFHGSDEWLLNPFNDDVAKFLVFVPLVKYGEPGSEAQPALAERWEHSPDYRNWTFHLRRDVRWHDGVPVTAHDIKFTVDLWSHPSVLYWAGPASGKTEVLDDYTLTASYPNPNVNLLSGWDVYYPKHLLEHFDPERFSQWDFWKQPVGNGPFRYVRHVPQTMMELEANPDYYAGKPEIERVVLKFAGGTPLTELLSGNVDAITRVSAGDVPRLETDPQFRVYYELGIGWTQILWNLRHPFFKDQRVRRALTSAVNRRELHEVLHLPEGAPLVEGACSRRQYYTDQCPQALPYDPAMARRVLWESGWHEADDDGLRERGADRFAFTILVPAGDPTRAAVFVQDQLSRVGVRMDVQTLDRSVVRERVQAGDFEAAIDVIASVPVQQKAILGEGSPIGYANPRVNALLDSAVVPMAPDEFDRIYQELGQILRADLPMTFLYPGVTYFAAHRRVHGLESPYRADPVWWIEDLWITDEDNGN
jgi:peptide/nickel transport system substrate-binding protein